MFSTKNTIFRSTSRLFITLLLSFALNYSIVANPTAEEYATVINLSGKQRMLSQKMTKEVLLIAAGTNEKINVKNLKLSSELFDRTIKGLRNGDESLHLPPTTSTQILSQLDRVNATWADYYSTIKEIINTAQVSDEQIAIISEKNIPLLQEMNQCVKLYEIDASKDCLSSNPGHATSINLAGKQRMLIQKMSKEFLLITLGYDIEKNQENLERTSALFDQTLKGLVTGDENLGLPGTDSELIVGQLQVIEELWNTFKPVVSKATTPSQITQPDIEILASRNLLLLRYMNKVVGYFEKSNPLDLSNRTLLGSSPKAQTDSTQNSKA